MAPWPPHAGWPAAHLHLCRMPISAGTACNRSSQADSRPSASTCAHSAGLRDIKAIEALRRMRIMRHLCASEAKWVQQRGQLQSYVQICWIQGKASQSFKHQMRCYCTAALLSPKIGGPLTLIKPWSCFAPRSPLQLHSFGSWHPCRTRRSTSLRGFHGSSCFHIYLLFFNTSETENY